MWFSAIRMGKAYVSFHLLALYMNPALNKEIPPDLKKRMQGKACFNFKQAPDKALLTGLSKLIALGIKDWSAKGWL